jgi:hypothetical protein
MAKDEFHSNPYPMFDRQKIEKRGDAAEAANRRQHDKALENVQKQNDKGFGTDFRKD